MKTAILGNNSKPGCARGRLGRTAALIAAVAICACMAVRLDAVVIDDFEDPTRSATLWQGWPWNGTGTHTFSDGHVTLEVTPPPNQGAFYNFLLLDRTWKLQEGRTLEFRADLLNSNDDGALAWFGFYLNDANRGYMLLVDEDTVALIKRENPGQAFFLTNGISIKVTNVKLVLSMTGTNSSILLRVKILDNDNAGAVIFERACWDTPAADPMHTDPMHPEWGSDNPPASYLGLSGYFLMCLFRDPALVDPVVTLPSGAKAEVVYDTAEVFEYFPPHLEIAAATNGADLTWQLPLEEQVVIEADQLPPSWRPCPQPYTRRGDAFCLNLPCVSPGKFFELTPGRQFTDDFSTLLPSWTPGWQDPGEDWVVTNGILELNWSVTNSWDVFGLFPLGTNEEARLRDFCTSVDILDWVISGDNYSFFALVGRGLVLPSGVGKGYFGGLAMNADGIRGNARLVIRANDDFSRDTNTFNREQYPPPYRLQLSTVGNSITVRLLNPATGQIIRELKHTQTSSTISYGFAGFIAEGNVGTDYFRLTADNYVLIGRKP
jgi:hypothetical protein